MTAEIKEQAQRSKMYAIALGVIIVIFVGMLANQFVPNGNSGVPSVAPVPFGLQPKNNLSLPKIPGNKIMDKAKTTLEKSLDVAEDAVDAGGKVIDAGKNTIDRFTKPRENSNGTPSANH